MKFITLTPNAMILPLEKYNQLVEKIVEAVPEIKELKMGCRVKHKDFTDCFHECNVPNGIIVRIEKQDRGLNFYYIEDGSRVHDEEISCCGKIIGRPIQLADVMRAINSLGDTKKTYAISQEGKFFSIRYIPTLLDYEVKYYSKWDLSLPLDQQNDEVKEFLYNLLVK